MATVLVVDDDPTNRELLRTLLGYHGHQVREAADGESALLIAGHEPPDAVITDVVMPGLDGYELARTLRSQPSTSHIPIAFSTAHYGAHEMQPLARACGVRDVIVKPAAPAVILAAVDALLGAAGIARPLPDPQEFVEQHRRTLRTKLTEKTALEARLTEELAETQRLTQSGTWDLDPRTGIVVLSGCLCRLLGLPSATIHRDQLGQRIHPDDITVIATMAEDALRTGETRIAEIRIADTTGVVHELIMSCRVATGGRTLWGVTQDVSDIRRAQRDRLDVQAGWQAKRHVVDALQQAMLPVELPYVAGVDLAAAYLPAPDRLDIGGDWYDALALPGGELLLSVGDVAGRSEQAAAVMGSVRAALRAYAVEEPSPARILARLNRFLLVDLDGDTYVTAVIARYDPASRALHLARAGHAAPILVEPGRTALLTPAGPALGILADAAYEEQRLVMAPGAALCAYTDGLVDRHTDPASVAERQLARIAAVALAESADAERLVERIIDEMLAGTAPDDDICLAVLRAPDL